MMNVFKEVLYLAVFLITGFGCLNLLSCKRSSSVKDKTTGSIDHLENKGYSNIRDVREQSGYVDMSKAPKGDLENRATEEEIQYFFPTGRYQVNIDSLSYYDSYDWMEDGYSYIYAPSIDGKIFIDLKENVLSALDIRSMLEKVELDNDPYYRIKTNNINSITKYRTIDEWYGKQIRTQYCKTKRDIPEGLIFDDNFIARLYDKNNKMLDEYKMRNVVNSKDYKRDPIKYQNKLGDSSSASAWLIGMLKLPPKSQREGLKYRVLRLNENGKPKPYLYEEAYKYPYQYYLLEETLPPYSEYKYWKYVSSSGCYFIAPFTGSFR